MSPVMWSAVICLSPFARLLEPRDEPIYDQAGVIELFAEFDKIDTAGKLLNGNGQFEDGLLLSSSNADRVRSLVKNGTRISCRVSCMGLSFARSGTVALVNTLLAIRQC